MNRAPAVLCVLCLALGGTAAAQAADFGIQITPQAINVGSEGRWLTVHADTPFNEDYEDNAYLDVVDVCDYTTEDFAVHAVMVLSDLNGNLVVRFKLEKVKDLFDNGDFGTQVPLYLCVLNPETANYEWGTEDVLILNEGD